MQGTYNELFRQHNKANVSLKCHMKSENLYFDCMWVGLQI